MHHATLKDTPGTATPARYVVTAMVTDTHTDATRVVLATSAEWVCVVLYWILILTLCLVATAMTLALARYNDSKRTSARVRLIRDLAQDYTMCLKPKATARAGHPRDPPKYTEPTASPPPPGECAV
jgi:hypothetical protein